MKKSFPPDFIWGTSTASAQIETPSAHNWRGVPSKDGYTFDRTTDHELRRDEDIEYIARFGSLYRCGVDWARLQTAANADFDMAVVGEYQDFFQKLNDRGTRIMFVFHHFTNPIWFEESGGWSDRHNNAYFLNYARQCVTHFGKYMFVINTFNEPNVYASNGYVLGNFPPFKRNIFKAVKVLNNMANCHNLLYEYLKKQLPDVEVGISLNTVAFKPLNLLGRVTAAVGDWWFNARPARLFSRTDFMGLSYYALLPCAPMPITEVDNAGELARMGYRHDKMWAYYPEGLGEIIKRFYAIYKQPIWITENGICTADAAERIASIEDYMSVLHDCIDSGIPVKGYTHWTTFDNFEWNLGPTYRFGLVEVDWHTKARRITAAGLYYEQLAQG